MNRSAAQATVGEGGVREGEALTLLCDSPGGAIIEVAELLSAEPD